MRRFYILYNNRRNTELEVSIVKRPNIPTSNKRYEEIEIEGRDGKLYRDLNSKEDVEISIEFNFSSKDPNEFHTKTRKIKRWLKSDIDNKLVFSDDIHFYYKVKKVEIDDIERSLKRKGKFTAIFTCEPYQYLLEGIELQEIKKEIYNDYDIAKPIYHIRGNGTFEFMVNDNSMLVDIEGSMIIDTDLRLAYNEFGINKNTKVLGNYEDLYLIEGKNTFEFPSEFTIDIIPNWRCEL